MSLMSACKDCDLIGIDQYDQYMAESQGATFQVWYLEKEDESFYYVKRRVSMFSSDCFRLGKNDFTIDVHGDLPMVLKSKDVRKLR